LWKEIFLKDFRKVPKLYFLGRRRKLQRQIQAPFMLQSKNPRLPVKVLGSLRFARSRGESAQERRRQEEPIDARGDSWKWL
jgi:hypothetical protein